MDDSTLKPQAYASKDKAIYDDNNIADLASIILFYLRDSSEATDTDPFGGSSNTTSIDLANFDSSEVSNADSIFSDSSDITSTDLSIFDSSSDASSITDSSVFIDCSI